MRWHKTVRWTGYGGGGGDESPGRQAGGHQHPPNPIAATGGNHPGKRGGGRAVSGSQPSRGSLLASSARAGEAEGTQLKGLPGKARGRPAGEGLAGSPSPPAWLPACPSPFLSLLLPPSLSTAMAISVYVTCPGYICICITFSGSDLRGLVQNSEPRTIQSNRERIYT